MPTRPPGRRAVGVVTFHQLRSARPDAWRAAATGWRRLAAVVTDRADTVARLRSRLATGWRGAAAGAALAALDTLRTALLAERAPALHADQILCEHAAHVERAQRELAAIVSSAPGALVTVADDGTVAVDRRGPKPDAGDATAARRIAASLDALLAEVSEADARRADRLRELVGWMSAAPSTGASAPLPRAGASPAEVRQWWDGLSPDQRAWLCAQRPELVGGLDGLPCAVRDAANRLVLDRLLAGPHPPAGLAALAARLAAAGPARAYLLALDPRGDGRAVVSLGDPDTARHVLTFVPGAGSDLAGIGKLLSQTDRLAAAAGAGTSTVLWLGYDAPDGVDVASNRAARAGAGALDGFLDGLRASAAGERAHLTVLGHSYGSTLVGYAARDHRLDVDDAVLVGSPGVPVDRATQLGLPGEHVWASTARHDVIRGTGLADRTLEPFDPDWWLDRWHGSDPGRPEFGGRRFTSDPGPWFDPFAAHNSYFDGAGLASIGAIARGDYDQVR